MASRTTSAGDALPRAERSSAPAATPICQSWFTPVRTIFRVMAQMIPTTAALKPASSRSAEGSVPKRTYIQDSTPTATTPGRTNPT